MTPDPYQTNASASNPQSWNRYTYVNGDPANTNDPTGLYAPLPTGGGGGYDWDYGGAGASDGGLLGNDGDSGFGDGGSGNACVEPDGFTPMPSPGCSVTAGDYGPPPSPPASPSCEQNLTNTISNALAGTPLAGEAADFVEDAQNGGLNPYLLVAIAGAESSYGVNIVPGSNNPFGLLRQVNGQSEMYSGLPGAYCVGAGCSKGEANAASIFKSLGGGNPNNPFDLLWPCNN